MRLFALAALLALAASPACAQERQFSSGTRLVNLAAEFADEANGRVGGGFGVELGVKEFSRVIALGVGGSVGLRHSSFAGILGSDYSLTVIPFLAFAHLHFQLPVQSKLELYAGPAAGGSLYRYNSADCAPTDLCGPDNSSALSIGLQAGARRRLTHKTSAWIQFSTGKNLPFANVGLSRKF